MASEYKPLGMLSYIFPPVALALLVLTWGAKLEVLALMGTFLVLAVVIYVAVQHAEVVALKVGEPFGSLILAIAVTIIEVGMILILIIDNPATSRDLARDTVFAAVMIATNAIVGASLLTRTMKHKFAKFNPEGMGGAFVVLMAMASLAIVLPSFTTSSEGPTYTNPQLLFVAIVALVLYATFVFAQTGRHINFFIPPELENVPETVEPAKVLVSKKRALMSVVLLFISLVSVVGLAKVSSPLTKSAVTDAGLPQGVVALSIAMLVMMPELIAAVRAARFGRVQTSLNLAYGSAIACLGLTIPVLAVYSILFDYQMNLGLRPAEIVLLVLTFIVTILTIVPGRATIINAMVHLSIFGSFIALVFLP